MATKNPDPDKATAIELARRLLDHARSDMSVDVVVAALPAAHADEVPMPSGARTPGKPSPLSPRTTDAPGSGFRRAR